MFALSRLGLFGTLERRAPENKLAGGKRATGGIGIKVELKECLLIFTQECAPMCFSSFYLTRNVRSISEIRTFRPNTYISCLYPKCRHMKNNASLIFMLYRINPTHQCATNAPCTIYTLAIRVPTWGDPPPADCPAYHPSDRSCIVVVPRNN